MKERIICGLLTSVGIMMIALAVFLKNDTSFSIEEVDVKSMAASSNMYVKDKKGNDSSFVFKEVEMEIAPASVDIPAKTIVYDGLTLDELAARLDRNLGSGEVAGKGMLIASYCLEKGVDPYIATAILLHETGCRAKCSGLVRQCNNVGGQKGWPTCGSTSYKRFDTLDDGIKGFINNLYKNYYAMGLNTVETIAPKYCEGNTWAGKIHWYINQIKNS